MNNSNEVKRTQGEWIVSDNYYPYQDEYRSIFSRNNKRITICRVMTENFNNIDKKEAKANAEFICKAVNEYDKLKEDNAALLDALKDTQKIIEYKINSTPTGSFRNELTDLNIKALSAIQKAQSK